MKVSTLREELERLESQGRGGCDLYVIPTVELHAVSHRPGYGVVVGFEDIDHPLERIDDVIYQPGDDDAIFLEFGKPDQGLPAARSTTD